MSEKPSDELIDRRLEFLIARAEQLREVVFDQYPDPKPADIRAYLYAYEAYYAAVDRYGREAPSVREERQQDNAAWN